MASGLITAPESELAILVFWGLLRGFFSPRRVFQRQNMVRAWRIPIMVIKVTGSSFLWWAVF
jgi:hypothetical protein